MIAAASWFLACLALAVAVHLKHPLLLPLRNWETGGLIALGLLGALLATWRARRAGWAVTGALLTAAWLSAAAVAGLGELRFRA